MRGIIPRAIEQVASSKEQMEDQGWINTMHVSFIEIYNEKIKDLLRSKGSGEDDQVHKVVTNNYGQNVVTNVQMVEVDPADHAGIDELMAIAAGARATAKTDMNAESSRSHSVFTLHLEVCMTAYSGFAV